MRFTLTILVPFLFLTQTVIAQNSMVGKWKTVDDELVRPVPLLKYLNGITLTMEKILDPLEGKVYKCRVWLENGNLMVRGYIGYAFIGRTQKWLPIQ